MKKTLAIALVMITVFSLCSVAFAEIGVERDPVATTTHASLSLALYEYCEDAIGAECRITRSTTKGIRKGDILGIRIMLTIPKNYDVGNGEFSFSITNAKAVATDTALEFTWQSVASNTSILWLNPLAEGEDNEWSTSDTAGAISTSATSITYRAYIKFEVAEDNLPVDIKAVYSGSLAGASFDSNGCIPITKGGEDYIAYYGNLATIAGYVHSASITMSGNGYALVTKDKTKGVFFACSAKRADGNAKVNDVYYKSGDTLYRAYGFVDELVFNDGTALYTPDDEIYPELLAGLNKLLGIMGYSMTGDLLYLNDSLFTGIIGGTEYRSKEISLPPYIVTITVSGPVTVPDTGCSSRLGTALMLLAALTAASVAIKRRRA